MASLAAPLIGVKLSRWLSEMRKHFARKQFLGAADHSRFQSESATKTRHVITVCAGVTLIPDSAAVFR